jgi:RNA polymerase sigma factor (sigma-70 family)
VIHDRYRQRLFAYTRQMLTHRQDAEDALQDIFVRAYAGLRASDRELALRAWLYRVAHNRCIDELRRPAPPRPEVMQLLRSPAPDPITQADQRESLRRLIADVRRLPDQQRSALLMRELGGMSYADLAAALGVTVPAVKSLLVRARLALAQALEARDTACSEIHEELIVSHDRGLRPNATARRHMRDCAGCREFRHQLRGVSRRFAAIVPTLGPLGVLANVLGIGGAGGGAAGGALAAGGAAGASTAAVSVGSISAGAAHVATLLAAAVVTAGGAVELQHTLPASPPHHRVARHAAVAPARKAPALAPVGPAVSTAGGSGASQIAPTVSAAVVSQGRSPVALIPDGSSSPATSSAVRAASSPSTTTVSTKVVKVRSSGGISTVLSGGGVSPSAPSNGGASTPGDGGTTSSTPGAGSSSSTSASTPASTAGSTQPATGSTSTPPSSTGSTPPALPAPSTGTSSGTPAGTGSSAGTVAGGPATPPQ